MDIGAKIELCGKDAVATPVSCQKSDFAARQCAQDIGVGGLAEGSPDADFFRLAQPGHRIQPAAADNSDFCLGQGLSLRMRNAGDYTRAIRHAYFAAAAPKTFASTRSATC